MCSNFYFKNGCCGVLKFYFAVSGEKSVVLLRCSASIWFKVQFRKSTSPYKVSRAGQGYIIVILSAVFSLFSLQHCGFWTPLCPLLKQEVHAVYVPLSMKLIQHYCLSLILIYK